ncbi:thioredoxin family protein [Cobetia sp. SIMBA_158]|uniref:thioredoxin family protein n=1 Tax=Cobetia sp. SIMBA_158 TaxID=3081617 RepID=UPI00397F943B
MLLADNSPLSEFVEANPDGVIVMLTAEWCGRPCDSLVPILERLESEHPHLTFVIADYEAQGDFMAEHDITAVPTVMAFVDGELRGATMFARNEAMIRLELSEVLNA